MLINSPNISGSLRVTGNIIATGSLTVGGTITGTVAGTTSTASYVEYTNVANKPALVSSSAQVAGYNIFATTGSNQFNGSQAITGSLTTTGTIVAQTLNVQQVTSSIVYSSGSNIFGNSVSNTQQFTGSVGVTGSLTVAGAATFNNSVTAGNNYLVNNLSATKKGYTYQSPASNWGPQVSGLYFTPNNAVDAKTTFTLELWNGVGSIITPLTIADTGAATFSSSVTAKSMKIENTGVASFLYFNNTSIPASNYIALGSAANEMYFQVNGADRMVIKDSGNVGIGTASPNRKLEINTNNLSTADGIRINFAANNTSEGMDITYLTVGSTTTSFDSLYNSDSAVMRFRMKTAATPVTALSILGSGAATFSSSVTIQGGNSLFVNNASNTRSGYLKTSAEGTELSSFAGAGEPLILIAPDSTAAMRFYTGGSTIANERMRITSSGLIGINTSSPFNFGSGSGMIDVRSQSVGAVSGVFISNSDASARLTMYINNAAAATVGTSTNHALQLVTNDTERMRITSGGDVFVGKQTTGAGERFIIAKSEAAPLAVDRLSSDGGIVRFYQDGTEEGNITVSGTTVSYNGGHLSRYSQTLTNTRIEGLVKGTVMSNLDQMAVWINPETGEPYPNEQLNCMKISDIEGDPNVAGVFVNWDNDDQTSTNDMNIAMTGDMIIRIAQGVTVQRGDLLISAGDGTAKSQSDDIIRNSTIAKVTSTHVTCTYEDGSYCVPCVLMAC